jgi:hypothetical protein
MEDSQAVPHCCYLADNIFPIKLSSEKELEREHFEHHRILLKREFPLDISCQTWHISHIKHQKEDMSSSFARLCGINYD